MTDAAPILQACQELVDRTEFGFSDLVGALRDVELGDGQVARLERADGAHPYGRRVLFAQPRVEAMVATWTRGVDCAPHDHGGSVGGVKVLRGRARHRVWQVVDGELVQVAEEVKEAGEVMACGADLVHSMGDDGHADSLVTLHFYTDSIDHMVVYDLAGRRTLVVDGGCGAWVPDDQPELIRKSLPGILPRSETQA